MAKKQYFNVLRKEYPDRSGYYNIRRVVERAHPFEHNGIKMFAYKAGIWKITEETTGTSISIPIVKTKERAIFQAKALIDKSTPEKLNALIEKMLKEQAERGFKDEIPDPAPEPESSPR